MKVVLKNIVLGCVLLMLAGASMAQRVVLAMPDDAGVWVRWTSPNLKNKNGINIYRQESGGGAGAATRAGC